MDSHRISRVTVLVLLVAGAAAGGGIVEYWHRTAASPTAQPAGATAPSTTEIERLKTLVPSQSHAMADVGYHWTNMWFAAEKKNWPLTEFFFNEARQHIQWTIRIRPVRKDPDGRDVDLKAIFDALDATSFAAVKVAIAQKDYAQFTAAYKQALDGCYSCHKTSGKPFLHPVVPTAPTQTLLDFAPEGN